MDPFDLSRVRSLVERGLGSLPGRGDFLALPGAALLGAFPLEARLPFLSADARLERLPLELLREDGADALPGISPPGPECLNLQFFPRLQVPFIQN